MALLMEGMPKPRGQRNEDNLLGMTDASFQDMGRAPVDELFAGRYAVGIDDVEFSNKEAEAKRIRDIEIANKDWTIEKFMKEGMSQEEAEFAWMGSARERIKDETGLDLYPGDLTRGEKEPQFMQEFSDQGAAFRHDGLQKLGDEGAVFLSQLIQHPRLFEQYPESQFLPVSVSGDSDSYGSYANYNHANEGMEEQAREQLPLGLMQLDVNRERDDIMSTVLHEMQHYISAVEGWENGGSPNPDMARQYIDDQLQYEGQDNMAGDRASAVQSAIDNQDGWFEFSRKNSLADNEGLQYQSYADLSGEELARAVQDRWENNTQGEYFYGSPDKHEEQNWNQEEGQIIPLDTTAEFRSDMSDMGLLGVLDRKTIMDVIKSEGEDYEGGPHAGKRDKYLAEMVKRIREMREK